LAPLWWFRDFAQDVAHQRDANFGSSHIFTQLPRLFALEQWQ
jgi:hypothetical protein